MFRERLHLVLLVRDEFLLQFYSRGSELLLKLSFRLRCRQDEVVQVMDDAQVFRRHAFDQAFSSHVSICSERVFAEGVV